MPDQWQHVGEARGLVQEILQNVTPPRLGEIIYKVATLDKSSILLVAFGQDQNPKQFLIITRPLV